ncbi:MAG: LytTR family DNA-binding domain-containing protein [Terricaulis sp.]
MKAIAVQKEETGAVMTMRVMIVDDERLAVDMLAGMLGDVSGVEVSAVCRSGEEAVSRINDGAFDLVFLDVEMAGMSGVDVPDQIRVEPRPFFVFCTAHPEFAVDAFGADAIDYLLKPITTARVEKAVMRAQRMRQLIHVAATHSELADAGARSEDGGLIAKGDGADKAIRIKDGGRFFFVPKDDIVWVEAAGDYAVIHTMKREFVVRSPIKAFADLLLAPQFSRVHRSAIVSIGAVTMMKPLPKGEAMLTLSNGAEVKISRSYKEAISILLRER